MVKLIKKCFTGNTLEAPVVNNEIMTSQPTAPALQSDTKFRSTFGNISQERWNSLKDSMSYIWKYLKRKNLSNQQIAGIMGNMAQESMFNHNQRGKLYSGIVQMSNNLIWPAATRIYGDSLDGQLNYIADYALGNLNDTKRKDHLGHKYAENIGYRSKDYINSNHNNAADSASHWGIFFERAVDKHTKKLQEEAQRRKYAQAIYDYYSTQPQFKIGGKIQWFK